MSGSTIGAGAKDDALDAALRGGRNQAPGLVDRHQRAEAAHLTQHRAAFDRIHPHGRALDGRRRRLEPREDDRHEADDEDAGDGERDSAQFLLARYGCGSLNVHCSQIGQFWRVRR